MKATRVMATIEPARSSSTLNKAHQKNLQIQKKGSMSSRNESGLRIRSRSNLRQRPNISNLEDSNSYNPVLQEGMSPEEQFKIELPKSIRPSASKKIPLK